MVHWHLQARHARDASRSRERFAAHLHATCVPGSDISASETIYGELVSNVARHAPGAIEILAEADEAQIVTLSVWDNGKGFAYGPLLPADTLSDRGRGLFIISMLSRRVSVLRTAGGSTEVRVVLPVVAKTAERRF